MISIYRVISNKAVMRISNRRAGCSRINIIRQTALHTKGRGKGTSYTGVRVGNLPRHDRYLGELGGCKTAALRISEMHALTSFPLLRMERALAVVQSVD